MFAVYATHADPNDPLSALQIGERPEPDVPQGWVRVQVTHASLNRHDLFTLRGISGHPEGIKYPIILGNDGPARSMTALPSSSTQSWVEMIGAVTRRSIPPGTFQASSFTGLSPIMSLSQGETRYRFPPV